MTKVLAAPPTPEGHVGQVLVDSRPDASSTPWHPVHTFRFFEQFVLEPSGSASFHARCAVLFNSDYQAVGPRQPRERRGVVPRAGGHDVRRYRKHVNRGLAQLITAELDRKQPVVLSLGLLPGSEPFAAVDASRPDDEQHPSRLLTWRGVAGGPVDIGRNPHEAGFDNEGSRHLGGLEPFETTNLAVTNDEYHGEFRTDQPMLCGASCATPARHERLTYRNSCPVTARWELSGRRLAGSAT